MSSSRQQRKAREFAALHSGEPFVIPNPWDAGSARMLEALGFTALATTSSGLAFTLGRLDGSATLDEVCSHVAELDRLTELPISADLENGYGARPEDAAHAIQRAAEAGAVGGSIEDWDPEHGLYDREQAVERVHAAAEAARGLDFPFALRRELRTIFAAIRASRTPSSGCRRSRRWGPMCFTRLACGTWRRSGPSAKRCPSR